MTWRGHHLDPEAARCQRVAVAELQPVEGDRVGRVHPVPGAGAPRELEAAGDVVVVDVGLEDQAGGHAGAGEVPLDPVDVALRVDDHRHAAVVDHVTAVTELVCAENLYMHDLPNAHGLR